MSDDERAIRQVISTWMEATQKGDVPRVLELMADDVVFLVPGQRPFGKEAFAAASHAAAGVRFEGTSEVLELEVAGRWAWCRTRLEVTAIPPQGDPVRRAGHTLSVFRKLDDGTWVLARDANLLSA